MVIRVAECDLVVLPYDPLWTPFLGWQCICCGCMNDANDDDCLVCMRTLSLVRSESPVGGEDSSTTPTIEDKASCGNVDEASNIGSKEDAPTLSSSGPRAQGE